MRKEKNWKRKVNKLCAAVLASVTALSLAACGGEENENNTPAKEWVYVPTYLTVEDENASYYDMRQVGDYLYYVSYGYDEETMNSYQNFCKYSLLDGSLEKRELNWTGESAEAGEDETHQGGTDMQRIGVTEEGRIVARLYS